MINREKIILDNPLPGGEPTGKRIGPFINRFVQLPGMARFEPFIRRTSAIVAPVRQLHFQPSPGTTHQGYPPLTILSANLWHDWPRHRRLQQRLEAVAQLIEAEAADIVLLQEVSRTADFHADAWLAARTGMAYVYAPANGDETAVGFEEGLAIFSRFPLAEPVLQPLWPRTNPFVHRIALGAVVETPYGRVRAFSVHLSLTPRKNAAQVRQLYHWVSQQAGDTPALIGGDFNASEGKAQMAHLRGAWVDTFRHLHTATDGTTHELQWPWGGVFRRQRLDYLFLRPGRQPWQVLEAQHVDAPSGPHSDHRAVLVRLHPEEPK